ncbi:hypothetical protein M407DRAFT_32769 [Tulasnella calospora MUT 4182]|uniref:Uncharacterized protein n=1 Tax=Tulasnella calospora MUT 4182 TaxID=1051891 RepID=A0A0C3K802_9AGAM|nr:hypothetical protein M407DRAFT_32769 [Tulasnella calospora MUT 4182]
MKMKTYGLEKSQLQHQKQFQEAFQNNPQNHHLQIVLHKIQTEQEKKFLMIFLIILQILKEKMRLKIIEQMIIQVHLEGRKVIDVFLLKKKLNRILKKMIC